MTKDGREIALSVDPNKSNDVCTWCANAEPIEGEPFMAPRCKLGHQGYFRALSEVGPIWVSDCGAGEPVEGWDWEERERLAGKIDA